MTPQLKTALGARRVTITGLLEIALPGHTIRLCDGAGVVSAFGEIFAGCDGVYGTLGSIDNLAEAAGDTMPALAIELLPPSTSAAVDLCQPQMQGSRVKLWLAVVDADTGAVVPDPELLFVGEVDTMALSVGRGERRVAVEVASVFDELFAPDEGARLSDSFHQWVWPGELGLSQMTGTPIREIWGPGEKPPAATDVPQIPRTGVQNYF